jgi:hypothetical protein
MAALPHDDPDRRAAPTAPSPDELRASARRVGLLLWLAVAGIVAAVFAWKLSPWT